MKIFAYLYDKMLTWSKHRHAKYYLAGVSFIEASIFPIPPDVMLVSMGLAVPRKAWNYAAIATLFSVIGGIFGYMIGLYAMELIQPYITNHNLQQAYAQVSQWFMQYGVWMVIIAGVTPIPYKIFTVTAGATQMAFLPFVLGSIVGRGLRFFLVSGLFYFVGAKLEQRLRHYIDWIGLGILLIIILLVCWMKWL